MFARVKNSGKYQYLQLVENRKEKGRVKQQVIATLGRMDELSAKGRVETLIRSLSRFSQQAILIITGKSDVSLAAKKIGPALIFERLWKQTGIGEAIRKQAAERKFGFDVERAVFLTVLHRLMVTGSDRFCDRWHQDYAIDGVDGIECSICIGPWGFWAKSLRTKRRQRPLPRAAPRIASRRRSFFTGAICSAAWTWFSSIPPRFTLKVQAETVSVSEASARIIARISSRWCSG